MIAGPLVFSEFWVSAEVLPKFLLKIFKQPLPNACPKGRLQHVNLLGIDGHIYYLKPCSTSFAHLIHVAICDYNYACQLISKLRGFCRSCRSFF